MRRTWTFLAAAFCLIIGTAKGQTDPAAQSLPYSQNFSSFTGSTTAYPPGLQGWTIAGSLSASYPTAAANGDHALSGGTASTTASGVYDFNAKIGVFSVGSGLRAFCLAINTTDRTNVTVTFDAMTIRNQQDASNNRQNELGLQFRVGTAGTFANISGSAYQNLTGAANNQIAGTTGQNIQTILATLPASCENQPVVELRWTIRDVTGSGNRPSFGVDNISVTGDAPTEVTLETFTATSYDGGIFLRWKTGYEARNLGFNIYREVGGRRSRITPSLVAGSALLAGAKTVLNAGRSYLWVDNQADGNAYAQYWLEDVDLNGKRTLHGPVSPVAGGKLPPQAESILLNKIHSAMAGGTAIQQQVSSADAALAGSGKIVAPASSQSTDLLRAQWEIAAKPAVKLLVRREGWHRVAQPQLVAAGLDPDVNPRYLQLFVDGQEQPMVVTGQDKARLDSTDAIEFYATALDATSTDIHTYWLVAGSRGGLRVKVVQARDGRPSAASSFLFTVERKERTTYFASLKNGDASNFFGAVITSEPANQTLRARNLSAQAATVATVEVALQGATDLPGSTPDHQVKVAINGSDAGVITFDGQERIVASLPIAASILREGDNTVTLTALGGEEDVSVVDYIRLTYPHAYAAEDDTLRCTAQGREAVRISGFTRPQVRVIDITDLNDPRELKGVVEADASGYSIRVASQEQGPRTLFAFGDAEANQPSEVVANQPSRWNQANNAADMVVISHRDFIDSVEPLLALRRSRSLKVAIVDVEDAYDEFGYGARSATALRDFLSRAKTAWKRAPRYVLLVGDASLDPRNYLGYGDYDFVPTKLIDTEFLETASDDWLVDFNNDGLPDMAVGRFPSRTARDAAIMATKTVAYENSDKIESLLLVADRNDGYDFEAANDRLRATVPADIRVEEVRRGRTDDAAAKTLLLDAINRGQKIVNYSGHGSVEIWRGGLLTSADAEGLNNAGRLSLFVIMTCLNAFFQDLSTDSLAEALMKAENGGAVAVWASSALTDPAAQSAMNQQLYSLILGSGAQAITMGEAIARAKAAISNGDVRRTWILLGDPAAKLK